MLPLLIGAGVAAAGTLGQIYGQERTNSSNETIANNATAANMAEAQRNRNFQADQSSAQQAFQERMANTAHQREMEDMKKAGINPMLSAKGVGAATPPGASASGDAGSAVATKLDNPYASLGQAASSAMDVMSMASGLKKQEAETEYIKTQSAVAKKGIPAADLQNQGYKWLKNKVNEVLNFRDTVKKRLEKPINIKDEWQKGKDDWDKNYRMHNY